MAFGLPDSWDCPDEQKQVKVEILTDVELLPESRNLRNLGAEEVWIEIPTNEVDVWIDKNGSSDKNRMAKVMFPTEWEDENVVKYITAFEPDDNNTNITHARVSFRDDADDDWYVMAHGFVGGVGQSSKAGVSKMWVYDYADLIDKIPVTKNFNAPSASSVMETTMREFNDRTPVRLTELALISPDEEILKQVKANDIAAVQETITVGLFNDTREADIDEFNTDNIDLLSPKTFYSNRDTLADILDWLCSKLNAIWYFKPTETGVVLVVDVAGRGGVVTRDEYSQPNGDISVIQNNATYEIDPINTVILRGSQNNSLVNKTIRFGLDAAPLFTSNNYNKEYPYVKVRAQNLYESNTVAAGGQGGELAYLVDSDSSEIDEAVKEAKDLLRELIEEEAEGVIKMRGKSRIETHDIIESYFTCAEWYPDEIVPLRYEVEEVKHYVKAGKIYRTDAYVSIYVGENQIEVVESRLMDAAEEL